MLVQLFTADKVYVIRDGRSPIVLPYGEMFYIVITNNMWYLKKTIHGTLSLRDHSIKFSIPYNETLITPNFSTEIENPNAEGVLPPIITHYGVLKITGCKILSVSLSVYFKH